MLLLFCSVIMVYLYITFTFPKENIFNNLSLLPLSVYHINSFCKCGVILNLRLFKIFTLMHTHDNATLRIEAFSENSNILYKFSFFSGFWCPTLCYVNGIGKNKVHFAQHLYISNLC